MSTPDFTKPVDVLAFFYNELGACGCSDFDSMIAVVKELLEWAGSILGNRPPYDTLLGGNIGAYYLIMGRLDSLRLIEHGSSIRNPFITPDGNDLLTALNSFTAEQIKDSSGLAYDGLTYGYGG